MDKALAEIVKSSMETALLARYIRPKRKHRNRKNQAKYHQYITLPSGKVKRIVHENWIRPGSNK